MKYLQIHVFIVFALFILLKAMKDVLPVLIMMSGTKIQENETTFYQLYCSSVWTPLGKNAEFIVNRKTVEHISVSNDTCFNSEEKECNVYLINNCHCIPEKNLFIIKLKERNIDENIFSCQMRFKDARNENIIRAVVSIAFNGSEDELYEYDVKIVGNRANDENKNITIFKEHSENLEIWLPVGFAIGLIILQIGTVLWCIYRRKYHWKRSEKTSKESQEAQHLKPLEPQKDKILHDDLQMTRPKLTIQKELHEILEDLNMEIQRQLKTRKLKEDFFDRYTVTFESEHDSYVDKHELLKVINLVIELHVETTDSLLELRHGRTHEKERKRKKIIEILEKLEDRHNKMIMSFKRGELDYWHEERLHYPDNFGKTRLMIAISKEDKYEVDRLTRERADYHSTDLSGNTVVHWACAAKDDFMISSVVARGYDINILNNYKVSPLMVTCSKGQSLTAEYLIKAGADYKAKDINGTTVFHCACAGGNVNVIDLLINQGCNIHKPNKSGITPLMVACSKSHLSIVQRLIKEGANCHENDFKGNSVFHWACASGNIEIINLLIEKNCEINKTNDYKITPLMVACIHGNFVLFNLLINNGAKDNEKDLMGDTVFHYSCAGGNYDIIHALIKKGCEIDKPNNSMITPLMVACAKGNLCAVIDLILSGANYNACDLKGRMALHWSLASGNKAISELLVVVSDKRSAYNNLKQKVMNLITAPYQETVARQIVNETDFSDLINTSRLYWSFVGNLLL